ncbi:sulfurtransferase TusA family protein [Marinicella sp. W31]|uniref:sulfurtransferase TusA family protein n=1 Tax=Marinicella sp. W31 TaxID=3023713 RepID=UPI003757345B
MTSHKTPQIEHHIDATGLECPQPLMRLKTELQHVAAGAYVEITTTDPHSDLDFTIWCERFGHEIVSKTADGEISSFIIRKSET